MPKGEKTPLLDEHSERYNVDEGEDETIGGAVINAEDDETVLTVSGTHIVCKSVEISQQDHATSMSHTKDKLEITVEVDEFEPKPIGNMECLMHLLKGMIGTGILAMPVAFKNGGLWVSFAVVFLFGIICCHCMYILVQCGNVLCERTGLKHLDYASVMEKAFETGHPRLRPYGKLAKNFINAFLLITQFGFCCVYIVFVAQNLRQVFEHWADVTLDSKVYIAAVTVLLVPYSMVKSLKALAPCSTFANFVNSTGLIIVLISLFQGLPSVKSRPAFAGVANLPLFFGQAIYAFEGIGLVLPLHNKMREKKAFLGKAGVLNLGLTITISLYVAVGFYGYLKYGDDALGSVTLNLSNEPLYQAVKLMFVASLFISYGLQFYVPINIIWPFIERKTSEHNKSLPNFSEYLFRALVVIITGGISAAIPHLDLLISLVGAFSSSFLALILPPVIELATFQDHAWWKLCKNWFIIILGFAGFATGTFVSLKEIVQTF